jgi:glycosyltransferase involved in cell wall biosynthesis
MINYEYPPLGGGGGVIHRATAVELATRHEITVLTSGMSGLPREEVQDGLRILRVPVLGRRGLPTASIPSMLSFFASSLVDGGWRLRRGSFQLVHTHFAVPTGPSAVLLARALGLPHVLSIHGGDLFDPSKKLSPHRVAPLRAAVRWVLRSVDRVVAQSRNTRQNVYRYYGVNREVDLIPHGIPRPSFRPASRAELGFGDPKFLLVTVGRLVRRKGLGQLLEAVVRLRDTGTALAIVGSGPQEEELRRRAAEMGIADCVFFTGAVDEERKYQILAASDLYVSTTLHEGFGLVYLEAMQAGLPVVSYGYGGQSDFLRDGETGALVAPGDVAAFVLAARGLLQDPASRERMARRGGEVASLYSIGACARAYERLYEETLKDLPGASRKELIVCPGVESVLGRSFREVPERSVKVT